MKRYDTVLFEEIRIPVGVPLNDIQPLCFLPEVVRPFGHSRCKWFIPSNAEATLVQSTRMQRFFINHLNPVMMVFIELLSLSTPR